MHTSVWLVQILCGSLQFQISFSNPLFFKVATSLLTLHRCLEELSAYSVAGDGSPSAWDKICVLTNKGGTLTEVLRVLLAQWQRVETLTQLSVK